MKVKGLFISLCLILICSCGCTSTNDDIDDYLNTGTELDIEAVSVMPDLKELPPYEAIEYLHTSKAVYLFESNSVVLVVKYDDETYKGEKEKLEENYTFYVKEEKDENQPSITDIIEDEFTINTYNFRIVTLDEENHIGIPKFFGMIGTSDDKNCIAYLYLCDTDLDAITYETPNDVMPGFVEEYFDYDFE